MTGEVRPLPKYILLYILCLVIHCIGFSYVVNSSMWTGLKQRYKSATNGSLTGYIGFDNLNPWQTERNTSSPSVNITLPRCPINPTNLVGPMKVYTEPTPWNELNKIAEINDVHQGGWHKPKCLSNHHMAIVIPYRNRDEHLRIFLNYMTPIFNRQLLDYRIFVIDQNEPSPFNRGMLMNIGFVEALKVANYSCFVFSDVDLLPENDRNIYGCPEQPRHMSVLINKFQYKLPYMGIFGGVENFRTEHYKKVNGFSNAYFGWGGEDDDLYNRIRANGFKLIRPPSDVARYTMFKHSGQPHHAKTNILLGQWRARKDRDGLNSMKYNVTQYTLHPLYTHIKVNIVKSEIPFAVN